MSGILTRWLINAVALWVIAVILPGIWISGVFGALIAGAVLGLVNAFIKPFLMLITLPVNILTLGLFTLVVNALMLLIVSGLSSGFAVHGFLAALLGSIVLSLISAFLSFFVGSRA